MIAKSTNAVTIAAAGMMSRGKYTLAIKSVLAIRLADDSVRPLAKNCQGSTAANTSTGSGAAPLWIPNSRRKATKTSIVNAGRSSAHATPMAVCL